jgi:hypothetical protein
MAFSDFTYPDVIRQFGLTERTILSLFADVPPATVPPHLPERLRKSAMLALSINTEKARNEWLIAPILGELWDRYAGTVTLFSGVNFDADPDAGLNGYCDFLLGRGLQRTPVTAPVVVVFEAKNDNIYNGFAQCIAGMVGAQRFNRREQTGIETVYGCSTTGSNWRFFRLSGSLLEMDMTEYMFADTGRILGVLSHMVGPLPQPAAA